MSKGSKRRPGENYAKGWEKLWAAKPIECPSCKEIELRPTGRGAMWECQNCKQELQF